MGFNPTGSAKISTAVSFDGRKNKYFLKQQINNFAPKQLCPDPPPRWPIPWGILRVCPSEIFQLLRSRR